MKLGLIGLGHMGSGIAQNLHRAGFDLSVYNRTRSKAARFGEQGVPVAGSAAELSEGSDILFTMVSDDHALRAIMHEQGVLESMKRDAVHISMSTVSPDLIDELATQHSSRQSKLISAPVFGRPESAERGELWVVAAGENGTVEQCKPMFDAIGRGLSVIGGEPSKANVVKIAGNFMIASMIEALGESYSLIRKSSIDPKQYLEIINQALFHSPIYQNYGTLIADKKYTPAGFKMTYGLKDLGLALGAAAKARSPMPLASLIHNHYLTGIAQGWSEHDWAALGEVCELLSGLTEK